ncbi:MAG: hypothetical protein CL930_14650 [Deltaproteobacteria bacterium]|nr:hypothetical protein [Deltaproteobacteria bacterium]
MPDFTQPWFTYSVCAQIVWPFLALSLNKYTNRLLTVPIATFIFSVCAVLPWTVPASEPAVRFVLIIPCFWVAARTVEIIERHARNDDVFIKPKRFLVWVLVFGDAVCVDQPEKKDECRQRGRRSAIRVALKAIAVTSLLAINSSFPLQQYFWLELLWMMFIVYTVFSGLTDLIHTPFLLMGIDTAPVFNAPFLARNLRDFWGRRWNLFFTRICNRLIFQKLIGPERPVLGATTVFLFSAILHEYMVWVSLERFDGRMLLFFTLHGFATIATTMVAHWVGRKTLMPRIPAIMLHFVFFTATAPLFFGPVSEIFRFHTWTLW